MKFVAGLTLFLSFSAFAGKGFDCRTGNDPHGGKFCHYTISACNRNDPAEAAECGIRSYARAITWEKIKTLEPLLFDPFKGTIRYEVVSDKGLSYQTVTIECTDEIDQRCKVLSLTVE